MTEAILSKKKIDDKVKVDVLELIMKSHYQLLSSETIKKIEETLNLVKEQGVQKFHRLRDRRNNKFNARFSI